jgi:adenylate cyclase
MPTDRATLDATVLFDGVIDRLIAAEVPICRASASLMTMHPEVYGKQILWRRGQKSQGILRPYSIIQSALYLDNPVAFVRREGKKLRILLEQPDEALSYPLCVQLKSEGCTDYLILPVRFRSGACSFVSWTCDRPGGFSELEIELLEAIVPVMSLRMELEVSTFALECLLETYLGNKAAERVLGGEFKRGAGQIIPAAIWTCDLRGFTTLADSKPIETVLALLDEYFECVVSPFIEAGGEVLNTSGDSVLGVFPLGDDDAATCSKALKAGREAFSKAQGFNKKKSRPIATHYSLRSVPACRGSHARKHRRQREVGLYDYWNSREYRLSSRAQVQRPSTPHADYRGLPRFRARCPQKKLGENRPSRDQE